MVGGVVIAGVRYMLFWLQWLCDIGDGVMQPEGMGHAIAQLELFAVGLVVALVVVLGVLDTVIEVIGEPSDMVGVFDWRGVEVCRFGAGVTDELVTWVWNCARVDFL